MTGYKVRDLLEMNGVRAVNLDMRLNMSIPAISTDSRTITRGQAFVALKGDTFDAHRFIDGVLTLDPPVCIVADAWYRRNASKYRSAPLLVVKDTLKAYGEIASRYRSRFSIPVIAITGSNGKTGTKEMVASVLASKYRVLHTEGNLNNHIGLPSTLLRLDPSHQVAVVEMGTNQPGDISYLCSIAQHTHALITNIGRAHLEKLGTREGIAIEKSAVYHTLPRDGVAFVNADDLYLRPHTRRLPNKITYGARRGSMVHISDVRLDGFARPTYTISAPRFLDESVTLSLHAVGKHVVQNAAAAFAVGLTFGCPVRKMKQRLEAYSGFSRRMEVVRTAGVTILNDTYNANPDSVLAALDTLMHMDVQGDRIVVLGDMLELGKGARREHRAIGEHIASLGIPYVLTFGKRARDVYVAVKPAARFARHYASWEPLADDLLALAGDGDVMLVKGSRGMAMERIVRFIHEHLNQGKETA